MAKIEPWDAQPVEKFPYACKLRLFQSCDKPPTICYTCKMPYPRHAFDEIPDVEQVKLQLCNVRAELYSLLQGCPADSYQGRRYNELKETEEELLAKLSELRDKFWNKAQKEQEKREKEAQKQREKAVQGAMGFLDRMLYSLNLPKQIIDVIKFGMIAGGLTIGGIALISWYNRRKIAKAASTAARVGARAAAAAFPQARAALATKEAIEAMREERERLSAFAAGELREPERSVFKELVREYPKFAKELMDIFKEVLTLMDHRKLRGDEIRIPYQLALMLDEYFKCYLRGVPRGRDTIRLCMSSALFNFKQRAGHTPLGRKIYKRLENKLGG